MGVSSPQVPDDSATRMEKSMRRTTVLLALLAAVVPVAASAAWDVDGNPVVIAPGEQAHPVAIAFGAGGILVAWVDQRGGDPGDIYAMALDADGDPAAGWPSGGVPICTASGEQSQLGMVSDEVGGAYLRWIDRRTGAPAHALQRITSTGSIAAGWPVDGLIFAAGVVESTPYALAADGTGGAYVPWTESDPMRARVARYLGSGTVAPGWPVDLPMMSASPQSFDMIADGAGGIVAIGNASGPTGAIRISGGGTVSPGWPSGGVAVFSISGFGSKVVAGQADDFFVIVGGPPLGCPCCGRGADQVKHLGLNGVFDPSWPSNGEPAAAPVMADGSGGLLGVVAASQGCSPVSSAWAARIGADRSYPWGSMTTPVCDQPNDQRVASIAPDGSGGAFIAWLDYRVGHQIPVLYAMRLDGAGDFASGWPTRGSMEAVGALEPLEPRVVATQPGTAVVAWVDRRYGTSDIYAKEMAPGPEGPPATTGVGDSDLHCAISGIAPNQSSGANSVTIRSPTTTPGKRG